ncbi:hypothetical protein IMAU80007_02664 [Lactiplantibacillus plantarum]|nr:hypothetical protein [Lactiplantibacillus plantarum]MCG0942149.1 hypothetical protein [Lactiplantibacillus plantarum]
MMNLQDLYQQHVVNHFRLGSEVVDCINSNNLFSITSHEFFAYKLVTL